MADQSAFRVLADDDSKHNTPHSQGCACTRPTQVLVDVRALAKTLRGLQTEDQRRNSCAHFSIWIVGCMTIVTAASVIVYVTTRVIAGVRFT